MYPWIHVSHSIQIPSYALIISLVYTALLFWVGPRADKLGLARVIGLDLSFAIMIGGFIGARLFHVFYEQPAFYMANPTEIFKVWEGGFVFYGGAIGALLASLLVFKMRKVRALEPWFDLFAPLLATGYALGRLACFAAGCCYGLVCYHPWAVVYPPGVDAPQGIPLHPTQLYASGTEFLTLSLLFIAESQGWFKKGSGKLFFLWMTLHSLGRIFMEYFRDDFRGIDVMGFSVSTFLSAVFFLIGFVKLIEKLPTPKKDHYASKSL